MVLGGAGWDRKESPEFNLHICGKDDTKIVVYNMEKCIEKGGGKIKDTDWNSCTILFSAKPHDTNYLSYSEDKFSNLICVKPS